MYKMICLIILLNGYNRLIAQGSTGQLVFTGKEQKMHFTLNRQVAGWPLSFSQSKFSFPVYEPHFKGLATQFIKPASTARSFFLEAHKGSLFDRYTMPPGWVCRQEWKLEKFTGVPFRLRLGSKEQVDWLEGKTSHR